MASRSQNAYSLGWQRPSWWFSLSIPSSSNEQNLTPIPSTAPSAA
jgi:hypothetical protein